MAGIWARIRGWQWLASRPLAAVIFARVEPTVALPEPTPVATPGMGLTTLATPVNTGLAALPRHGANGDPIPSQDYLAERACSSLGRMAPYRRASQTTAFFIWLSPGTGSQQRKRPVTQRRCVATATNLSKES